MQKSGGKGFSLPLGPLLMSPKPSYKLVISSEGDNVDKTKTLLDLFDMFDIKQDVVVGAFGNKNTDTDAYTDAGISTNLIYLINEDSEMINVGTGQRTSYQELIRNLDTLYPPVYRQK